MPETHHHHHNPRTSKSSSKRELSPATVKTLGSNPPKETVSNILIDYTTAEGRSNFTGARFIFECGHKLNADPMTIATAAVLFHRFFQSSDPDKYDIYLVAATSVYLAGKVVAQEIKIRDVVNVARATLHRDSTPLDLGDTFFGLRDSIIQTELHMMRKLSFKVTIEHPHRFLVHYLKTLEEWIGCDEWKKTPIARTAWAILQDFHHDPSILDYPPQALAEAAIELSMVATGSTVPLCSQDGRNSWQLIFNPGFDRQQQEEIMRKMLDLYEYEIGVLSEMIFHEKTKEPKIELRL